MSKEKMTASRAEMFMIRFKHEEKMLGPNEQAALDYVIDMLIAKQEQGEPALCEPVAWFWFDERDGGEWMHIADSQINADKFGNAKVIPLYTTPPVLPPVEGDLLPQIGSKVLIHLARQDEWVEHTVVGYYVWGGLDGPDERMHRVFVRVADADGILNARMLRDVRPVEVKE